MSNTDPNSFRYKLFTNDNYRQRKAYISNKHRNKFVGSNKPFSKSIDFKKQKIKLYV